MIKTAIIAVAYNRVHSLERLLGTLNEAAYPEPVTLIISIDKSKTAEVEDFADAFCWKHGEKRVSKHSENLGLRRHMLSLGQYFDEFDALIVLEDDVTVVPSFMYYAKSCLEKYKNEKQIAGISLYSFSVNYNNDLPFMPVRTESDVYMMQVAQSWGEIWMKDQWLEFKEWYDKNDEDFDIPSLPSVICHWPKSSWLKYHTRYCIEQRKFFIYPYMALSTNNGDAGSNFTKADTLYQAELQLSEKTVFQLPDVADIKVRYDAYFEPMFMGETLCVDENELTVDLYATKNKTIWARYVLSTAALPYVVVRSFGMQLRPIEANIIYNRGGDDIRLYDTTQSAKTPVKTDIYDVFYYRYGKAFNQLLFMVGCRRVSALIMNLIVYKIKKIFKGSD